MILSKIREYVMTLYIILFLQHFWLIFNRYFLYGVFFRLKNIKHGWYKYMLCGIQGMKEEGRLAQPLTGINIAATGNIPPAAGLSSSSALVCVASLVVGHYCKSELSLQALAELCARSERYIGTESGGMDQAASLLSSAGMINYNQMVWKSLILLSMAIVKMASSHIVLSSSDKI